MTRLLFPSGARRRLGTAVIALLVVSVFALAWGWQAREAGEGDSGYPLAGRTTQPPWNAPAEPSTLVRAAGLDLGPMGTAEHYHPHLTVVVDGAPVEVPAHIGVDLATGSMSALHTHTPDGEVHVEADRVGEEFTLGQLFTQWNVYLSSGQVGGVEGEVVVTVNDESYDGDPRALVLEPEQRIVVAVSG